MIAYITLLSHLVFGYVSGIERYCYSQTTECVEIRYFISPQIAVEKISIMLKEKNWIELAQYYDLSKHVIDCDSLLNGRYFYTEEKPESAHPAGFWKYMHPFHPSFKFNSAIDLPGTTDVVEVTVDIIIDQGTDIVQRGFQTFLMQRSAKGYQVILDKDTNR